MTLNTALFWLCAVLSAVLACQAYLALHRNRITLWEYAAINLVSCVLGLISLVGQFNIGSLMVELFFGAVSIRALLQKEPQPNGQVQVDP